MKVLITELDLYGKIGGGQTVYRSLVERNPDIDFYYLTTGLDPSASRPANAHALPYKEAYSLYAFASYHDVSPPEWVYGPFVQASNIAASVAGQEFDIVEVADYEQFGTLLRPALYHHGVSFERLILSLHGRISTTIRFNWATEGHVDRGLETQEQMQYLAVDARYGISRSYLDEWRAYAGLEGHYLDPLWILGPPSPTLANDKSGLPSLNFVGRTEKRKGPDIFVELVWWLPRSTYSKANIVGPESYDPQGVGSGFHLYTMAQNRAKDICFLPRMGQDDLTRLFAGKAMTFLPSRYDSFNLLALESLFAGCPTAIGSGAGVVRFLAQVFPEVPFVTIDMENLYACLPEILPILRNYEEYRYKLVQTLRRSHAEVCGPGLKGVYASPPRYDSVVRAQLERWYEQLMTFYEAAERSPARRAKVAALQLVKGVSTPQMRHRFKNLRLQLDSSRLKAAIRARLISSSLGGEARVLEQALKGRHLQDQYRYLFYRPERTEADLSQKIRACWDIADSVRIDRVRIWREIARLERLRGNELVAATYELRVMRAFGYDRFGDLGIVARTLRKYGFEREGQAAEAMYGPAAEREERCHALLEQARRSNQFSPRYDYELMDDRRSQSAYRVSVIVSLYNTADKLPFFLRTLCNQTMIKAATAEVILVDTGSPGGDYSVFRQVMESLDIHVVYARSATRETIQGAWNRGIALSRAPYVAFLGVDETLLPNCLELLAFELDADPMLDWVQANSLVTDVDPRGVWMKDIMVYDRTGYTQDLVYLETCYLSWVGALHRRSIHDRFGHYDPTFSAAGDTEFKNRILPFIRSKAIPVTLGVFWNFPGGRTTLSPRAEIEDLRAWYLHRTLAGVRYAFSRRDPGETGALLRAALRYRKSYCKHWSTDVEYAGNVAALLRESDPDSSALQYAAGIAQILEAYRWLDYLPRVSPVTAMSGPARVYKLISRLEREHRNLGRTRIEPEYRIFNDNRYEQHSFVWRSSD